MRVPPSVLVIVPAVELDNWGLPWPTPHGGGEFGASEQPMPTSLFGLAQLI